MPKLVCAVIPHQKLRDQLPSKYLQPPILSLFSNKLENLVILISDKFQVNAVLQKSFLLANYTTTGRHDSLGCTSTALRGSYVSPLHRYYILYLMVTITVPICSS